MNNTYHKDEIIRLHNDKFSYSQIAKILNCSKGTISYHLGKGQKEKTRIRGQHTKAVRKEMLNKLYKSGPCMDCGGIFKPHQMDLDHRPGVKKIANVNLVLKNMSWEDVVIEAEKCDLVCANCHRDRTQNRINAKKGL